MQGGRRTATTTLQGMELQEKKHRKIKAYRIIGQRKAFYR